MSNQVQNSKSLFGNYVSSFWQASLRARPESKTDAGQASMTSERR